MLKLSKTNAEPYDYVSQDGDMTNPIVRSATIDKTGGTVVSPQLEVYLIGTDEGSGDIGSYEDIVITPQTATTGITWEVSLDGINFFASIEPDNMDVSEAHQVESVFVRMEADNSEDSPLDTGNFAAEFKVQAKENPPEL